MLKNPTPQQIAFFASFPIAIIAAISYFIAVYVEPKAHILFIFIGLPLLVYVTSYFAIIYFLKKYIYRKIKLIYKNIHRQKVADQQPKLRINVQENILEQVEKEVEVWAQNQHREMEKYRSWADYRRKYIGDISHELKTPVFNIQGYLHTLLEGGLYDQKINKAYLRKAIKNVERLQTIIEDLSAISRFESEAMNLDVEVFDIKALTEEVFEDLEFKAAQKNIRLGFKEGNIQHAKVKADKENIRQVLMNLIGNSIKYSDENGQTLVSFYDMDKRLLIEVSDKGIGIPASHIPFLFDRFYRVDKSRSRKQGGSGLGLAIVKHIIEAHKQSINVRSTPGVGSTFGFTLDKI
ncbi:MAG: sensor histidine kinase [Saprospiraceae bacterium]|nr:sensor histidine kinase [Saprospiraceae bacterium]MCB9322495.1 sensor histidine kinase [Lewinellaceae bacterium]